MENYIENRIVNGHKRLACNIGDRVYIAQRKFNKICYGNIVAFNSYKRIITIKLDSQKILSTNFTSFNKTIFLTREEAENVLKGMNNDD